jgi:serine/threonine protein phosphatase PrpC
MSEQVRFRFVAAADSHVGRVRRTNEDTVFAWVSAGEAAVPRALLVVADGLGGHQAGEVASRLAVDVISGALVPFLEEGSRSPGELEQSAVEAIHEANDRIYRYAEESLPPFASTGTTVACVMIQGDHAVVANVGDSRVYVLDAAGLEQLTVDHTRAWELVAEGILSQEEVAHYPLRNMLTRSVGTHPSVQVDVKTVSIQPGQRLLLCSDGLWGTVDDPAEIEQILRRSDTPEQAVGELIRTANVYGGEDNIGVVVCDVRPVERM